MPLNSSSATATVSRHSRSRRRLVPASRSSSVTATTIEYRRPWLYDKQRDAIFCPERWGIIEASTKAGKTVGCLIWLAEQAMRGKPGWNFWWIAPSQKQAKMAFRRLKHALPFGMGAPHEPDSTLTFPNGVTVGFKTGEDPDLLYGEDVYAAVVDEASRMREEAWHM